jgi:DNA polymerase-3 subunit delta'
MRSDVSNVFLKILEEPPGSATLILTASSTYSLLPTILSRCMQFHFAPLPVAEVETILKANSDRKPAELKLAAQLSEGSPGLALELDLEEAVEKRKAALRVLERAARGQGFSQLFADTAALAKDRESSFEDLIGVFYGLLSDLLEINAGIPSPLLRNPHLSKELQALSRLVDQPWIGGAISGMDDLAAGLRRNLNRQLGLDSLALALVLRQNAESNRR